MVTITGKHHPANKRRRPFWHDRGLYLIIVFAIFFCLFMILKEQTAIMDETLLVQEIPHLRFQFLQTYNPLSPDSDVAELRHCNLHSMNWKDYFTWALRILDEKVPQFIQANQDYDVVTDMEQEFVLELLELYATFHGSCRFDTGYPFVPHQLQDASLLFDKVPPHDTYARVAIVIIAFQDAPQLQRLLEAIHMPHYYIVLHVERRASHEYLSELHNIASHYNNVQVVQFGTIIYRTDLVTTIQLQLMKWLSTSTLEYDYHITLNGAAYPLYSAEELAIHLKQSSRNVWLGELTHHGVRVQHTSQAGMLVGAKRLSYTRGNTTKGTLRLSQSLVQQDGLFQMNVSEDIANAMSFKTVSGNQAVYSYDTVQQLLSCVSAMKLFALAKYACCGILEERTWIAAMQLLGGVEKEALHNAGGVWQVWGGVETCQSSVNNAILTTNSLTCFKVEDATREQRMEEGTPLYINGSDVMAFLKDAKKRGFLFARKFHSDNDESMALLEEIRREIHDS